MPVRHDLEMPIWRGDIFSFPLCFFEGEETLDEFGDPVDPPAMSIEDRTIVFTLKKSPHDADEDAALYYSFRVPVPDVVGALGQHTIILQPSQTQELDLFCYTYQVQLITPALPEDSVVTYIWGKAPVRDS